MASVYDGVVLGSTEPSKNFQLRSEGILTTFLLYKQLNEPTLVGLGGCQL